MDGNTDASRQAALMTPPDAVQSRQKLDPELPNRECEVGDLGHRLRQTRRDLALPICIDQDTDVHAHLASIRSCTAIMLRRRQA